MSNEPTDEPSGNEGRPPPDWPGAAKAREEAEAAENQVLPPDLESHEPEPPVLSHIENEPVIIGNAGRTVEQQAAVDAERAAERGGQPLPDTATPGGMTDADIDAVSDLPVDADAPPEYVPDDTVFAVGHNGTLIAIHSDGSRTLYEPPKPSASAQGLTQEDIDAVKDLPVDSDAPMDFDLDDTVFAVGRDGTLIAIHGDGSRTVYEPHEFSGQSAGAPFMDVPDVALVMGQDGKLRELPRPPQEPDPLGGDVGVIVNPDRESFAVSNAPRRGNPMLVYGGIAAALAVLIVGLLVVLGGGGDDETAADSGDGGATGSGQQAAAPTSPPPTSPPAAPAAFTANAQQLRNANVTATDLGTIYGTCVYEIPTNGATDVEQSVSSSPAMMQAMTAAGYQGFRSSSRAPTPCQGLPYNAASVSGNARDVAAAQALFAAAARTNYQALFPGFTPFDVPKGQLDELNCQHGVFVPAGNIIAVACWMRKGTTVSGVFILLPPGSAQTVIDEAKRDAQAYVTRLDGVLR